MKTKFYWFALLASAALIAQAQADGRHGGGGGGRISSRGGGSSFHSAPHGSFGAGRAMYSGPRFSSGVRSSSMAGRSYINTNRGTSIGTGRFSSGNINRGNRFQNSQVRNRFGQLGNNSRLTQRTNGAGQFRNGRNLPSNWRNHVVAQHSGNWQRNWDRGRDHFWHGHRCRFVDGSWFIFDFGFPWYPYGYPYDYYAYDYYPGVYDSDVYEGQEYYGSSDQDAGGTVAAAQEQLAREGYYRGEIDGVLGPATRRAIASYQSNHGLRVTGALTTDTLEALGLPRVANN